MIKSPVSLMLVPSASPIVMDEESFLSVNGASRLGIGDAGLHRSVNTASANTHRRNVAMQAEKDRLLIVRRVELREVYKVKAAAGEIRPPSYKESVIRTANGHPDNESVQAARRIAQKRGWEWIQGAQP
jgi:hypothetical protein